MVLNNELITDIQIDQSDYLKISEEGIKIPGNVSLYEEGITRTNLGYTIEQWYNLSPVERATEVAIKRIRNAIDYHQKKEEERRMKHKK